MAPDIINLKSRREGEFKPATAVPMEGVDFAPDFEPPQDLMAHLRQVRRRGRVAARWLALAVLAGTIAGAAFVNFFAR